MNTIVIYKSKTGFTRQYAGAIAQSLGAQLMPLKDVSPIILNRYENVIYGGGLYAASINGLKKMKKKYAESSCKHLVVFACGATPNVAEGAVEDMWKKNLTPTELNAVPHFYMQAGLAYEKMSGPDKLVMKMVAKVKHNKALESSHDITDLSLAQPLIDCVNKF